MRNLQRDRDGNPVDVPAGGKCSYRCNQGADDWIHHGSLTEILLWQSGLRLSR